MNKNEKGRNQKLRKDIHSISRNPITRYGVEDDFLI
jgi:hypothetical protein